MKVIIISLCSILVMQSEGEGGEHPHNEKHHDDVFSRINIFLIRIQSSTTDRKPEL